MKIILMVPEMEMGGVEQGTYDLARGFVERGHETVVFCAGGRMSESLRKIGVRRFYLPLHRKDPGSFLFSLIRARRIIRRMRPQIVHARSRVPALVGYLAVRDLPDVHLVTSFHSFYNRHFPSRIMGSGERVIAVSAAVADDAAVHFGVSRDRLRVVYNGVSLSGAITRKDSRCFAIGTLGRLTAGKGFEEFLAVLREVRRVFPDVRGVIGAGVGAGKTDRVAALNAAVLRAGLADGVTILVNVRREEFFSRIDIYLGSFTQPEGFGRVLVEAQLAALPVIAPAIGASAEVVRDNETGYLVSPGVPSFARAVCALAGDGALRIRMGESGRVFAEREFPVKRMIEETLRVYREITD